MDKEWLQHPETERFFGELETMKAHLMEAWAEGAFTAALAEGTIQLNSNALGKVQMLNDILEMKNEE